jgi:predicted AlkP superfamily phosphohydrolase/phosphomutase
METRSDPGVDVLLVGLDAACESVLKPLYDADAIPTIEGLFEAGVAGPLTSSIPPWTPSAWPTAYTGVNPGKHGVFGFLTFEGYDWDVVNATDVRAPTLWEILDYHGVTNVVVNGPVTHPPPEIDGAVVPGYVAPEDPVCHPEGLLDDLRAELGDYRVYADGSDPDRDEAIAEYRKLSRMRGEAFRYLVERFEPDFGFVQFQQTDTVFHEFPGDHDAVCAVYETVDEQVGAILEVCDPDTVMVVSDHGIDEYDGYEFRVNEFLRNRGFVETARGGEGMPSWDVIWDENLREGEDGGREPGTLERALAAAAKAGLTSQRIGAVLERLGLAEFVLERVPGGAVRAASERVSFSRSRAYMRSRIELGVRINLAGREPDGVVPRERYEPVRETLIEVLASARTPDGNPVFEEVGPREEFFHGPHVEDAPDVVAVPADYDQFLSATLPGEEFGQPREPWNHKRDGVVALTGTAVDESATLSGAALSDVAPTVLAALGLPASDDMDGGVLAPVAPAGRRGYPDLVRDDAGTTDDREVEERLADLGYLEQ